MDVAAKRRATRFVLLTVFTYSAGFGIIMPVLPELIVELEGISLSEATLLGGFVAASYAVFQFLMGPLVGNLGDRYGRRPVFLLSLMGFAIDFVVMGFAQNIIWLFVGRSIAGALGAIFGPANAAMADMSSDVDRARGFGLVSAAFGVGFVIGPAVGGLLGGYGTRLPFFVAGGMAFVTFVYGFFVFEETMPEENKRRFSLKRANPLGALLSLKKIPSVLGIAVVYLLWITCSNVYPVSWAYFAPIQFGWDSRMVGISLTLVGISMAFAQTYLLSHLVSKFGERKAAFLAISVGLVGLMLFGFVRSGTFALFMCLFIGIQAMAMPCINALMSRRTPKDMQGELQGFNGSMAALSSLIAPLVYNTTLSFYTRESASVYFPGAAFMLAAILGVCAFIALLLVKPVAASSQANPTQSTGG
ncbi:MAG: MFS transporter [Gammaproteobacteria bacterium]